MTTKVRPFSNGSEYGFWSEANCYRCKKDDDCPLAMAFAEACIGDGTVTEEVARRTGRPDNFKCGEFEEKPPEVLADPQEFKIITENGWKTVEAEVRNGWGIHRATSSGVFGDWVVSHPGSGYGVRTVDTLYQARYLADLLTEAGIPTTGTKDELMASHMEAAREVFRKYDERQQVGF